MKMTFKTVVIGGLIVFTAVVLAAVFIPVGVWDPPQTDAAHPYTEQQERGRILFYSNGCNYCHTQYVRIEDTGMGPISQGGNYTFDNPAILGSERTGPDLSYLGRKRSEQWEINHLISPRVYSPLSIMPSFEFLSQQDLEDIAAYLYTLGDRTAAEWMIQPPANYAGESDQLAYGSTMPTDEDQGWETWLAADMQEGKELYVDRCLTCHGCAGNGLGSYAGTLVVTPADFGQEPFRNMPDDQWIWHVSEGVPGTVMPPWKESMTERERWLVIRYIQQTFARPIMRDPAEGDPPAEYAALTNPLPQTVEMLEEGKAIFIRECMVCHGDAGTGGGPYAEGLQPSPPDFSDGSYGSLSNPSYTDADYFWRISEGLPWSAMPSWKLRYSEEDRWKLVYYIRVNFTQTLPRPGITSDQVYPDVYLTQTMPQEATEAEIVEGGLPYIMPETPSYERGKLVYLLNCAHCHGLSGQGNGWDGQYLDVLPANFTDPNLRGMSDGDYYARVSFGIQNSAMPTWGEFLPENQRWDVIKFLQESFQVGSIDLGSIYADQIANDVLTLSSENWTGEGNVISAEDGQMLYETYCQSCHNIDGQGNGAGVEHLPSGGPAAFPANLPEAYVFWRVWEGVSETIMPPFNWLISEGDIWNITAYVEQLTSSDQGGQP
jgi:cytochrome c oxidase cbb3-type subunit 2